MKPKVKKGTDKENVVAIQGEMIGKGGSAFAEKAGKVLSVAIPAVSALLIAKTGHDLALPGHHITDGLSAAWEGVKDFFHTLDRMNPDTLKFSIEAVGLMFGKNFGKGIGEFFKKKQPENA